MWKVKTSDFNLKLNKCQGFFHCNLISKRNNIKIYTYEKKLIKENRIKMWIYIYGFTVNQIKTNGGEEEESESE